MKLLKRFYIHTYPAADVYPTFCIYFLSFGLLDLCLVRGHISQFKEMATEASNLMISNYSRYK